MTFPTSAEMKANMLVGWKEYWPIFITLIFTFLGWLAFSRNDGLFIQEIGAVGVIIFLPLFKMRGFKFKVQHPVLGYWRLLKKLHRVS